VDSLRSDLVPRVENSQLGVLPGEGGAQTAVARQCACIWDGGGGTGGGGGGGAAAAAPIVSSRALSCCGELEAPFVATLFPFVLLCALCKSMLTLACGWEGVVGAVELARSDENGCEEDGRALVASVEEEGMMREAEGEGGIE